MKTLFIILISASTFSIQAQDIKPIIKRNNLGIITYAKFPEYLKSYEIPASSDEFFKNYLNISINDEFKEIPNKGKIKESGFKRFEQYYRGVKVEGSGYAIHYKNGKVFLAQGHFLKISDLNIVPTLSISDALSAVTISEKLSKDSILNFNSRLLIIEIQNIINRDTIINPKLVYQVGLSFYNGNSNRIVLIDAVTGQILSTRSKLINYSATANFNTTLYNGQRTDATTQFYGGNYNLSDSSRGAIIHTWDLNGNTNYNSKLDLHDGNNEWTTAEYHFTEDDMGLDIHWGLQKIYDYLLNSRGIDSYDGQGSIIRAFFHYGTASYLRDNAFWDPDSSVLAFGDGDVKYKPVASIDAVSHEFGHGMTEAYVGWLYDPYLSLDQCAFHEGLSDIWAAILEYRINNSNDMWKIGEQVIYSSIGDCLRNISDPDNSSAEIKMVDYYGNEDYFNGGKYERSGVFSHWFYLLADQLGINTAEELIASAEFNGYLQFTYSYSDIRQGILDAAEYVRGYSECSNVYKKIQDTWHTVGVGNPAPSYGVSITGSAISTLDFEGHWHAQGFGGCGSNYTYEWFIGNSQSSIGTGCDFYYTFDDNFYSPGYINIRCKVYDGETYAESIKQIQLIEHDPLTVSILGDEIVCLDGYGMWDSQVSGGVEPYTFEWHLNDAYPEDGSMFDHEFLYGEWYPSQNNHLDLRIYDQETYIDADPFYFELEWCRRMRGDSLQIYPNPARNFVEVYIIDEPNIQLSNSANNHQQTNFINAKDFFIYFLVDNQGKTVFHHKTNEKFLQIDTSNILPGIYQIMVYSSKGLSNRQIVVTH